MAVPLRNLNGETGDLVTHTHACTLADYTAAGTTTPVVNDLVSFSTTGNWYVARAADNSTKRLGSVTKIELAPSGTDVGYVTVQWYDVLAFVELTTDDESTVTLGNSCIKDGDTTVADNVDAGATTGSLIAVAKSATSGAGSVYAAVCAL